MKKIPFIAVFALLGLAACDQAPDPSQQAQTRTKENTTVFEDKAVTDANKSVQAFGEAMEAFEAGDKEAVARHLQAGIDALANEGKGLEGELRTNLERAIRRLEQLRLAFQRGEVATADEMLKAIAEAERDVPHKLLSGYSEEIVEPQKQ